MPRSTECKHLLKDSVFNSLQDRICLQYSLGGGANPFSAIRLFRPVGTAVDISKNIKFDGKCANLVSVPTFWVFKPFFLIDSYCFNDLQAWVLACSNAEWISTDIQ